MNISIRTLAASVAVTLALSSSAFAQSQLPDLDLEELMTLDAGQVFGASERLQPAIEAPASVSFITKEEIARMGTARWRTYCAPSAGCTSSTTATTASSGRAGSPCRGTTTAESCCWSTDTA